MTPIYEPLDPGIADVVHLLRKYGIDTFTSCQGGEGHAFSSPTVRIKPVNLSDMQVEVDRISEILASAGYGGYYIKCCHSYQWEAIPWQPDEQSFIEVEFWAWPWREDAHE
ncbi:MAG: hypothetical protein L0332_23550 [Chloroflexi bacterium]|nr:hypothetical protein [Chloroflexota bacterium]